jgi:aspartate/methionine/tyrosine aminotransferase
MEINKSGAQFSAIVKIGEDLKDESLKTREDFLYLNRGINQVVGIDLSEIIPMIDFNTPEIRNYARSKGMPGLVKAINDEYFNNLASFDDIFITAGGMHALALTFQTLSCKQIYSLSFYWGAYTNSIKIAGKAHHTYDSFEEILVNPYKFEGAALIICDPNNPTGSKTDDRMLFKVLDLLKDQNTVVIWDGPYRRVFYEQDDTLYQKLLNYENVIITESFSKSIGLSGQRVGFVHCKDQDFKDEFAIRLLYSGNGINSFGQILVEKLLTTPEGKKAAINFRRKTQADIAANILYLKKKGLLAEAIYKDEIPLGIFVIINKSFDELKEKHIGSVPFGFFTKRNDLDVERYTRICVSVPKEEFARYFDRI